MCSPRQARLNALRGFFHTQFIEEILAKYCENPSCSHHKLVCATIFELILRYSNVKIVVGRGRSVLSDYDSDPVTRYRTCGLSGTKLNFTNTQICISEYP